MIRRHAAFVTLLACCLTSAACADDAKKISVLIVDGQNNHQWKITTPVMVKAFEDGKHFEVDVATSPPGGQDMSGFQPEFSKYDVVVSNYNGDSWSDATNKAFLDFVEGGGGVVIVHAADNSFPDWPEYNRIIGLGGWGGRKKSDGPYIYFEDGRIVRDAATSGTGGSHGAQHEFQVVVRDANHPVTEGMPREWLHDKDELYDSLRGPGEDMRVLATAYSEKSKRHEPMMLTIRYGKGRVFHTPMGHADYSMKCVGFITTLLRGTEWAATGHVKTAIPNNFPGRDKSVSVE
jgi:type 1 glutamine amidotransferase